MEGCGALWGGSGREQEEECGLRESRPPMNLGDGAQD